MSRPSDLVQGTLDLLILKILALEPLNGFAVSQRLKQVSGDVLQVSDGSLYPALHKLEQEGWISAEWKASENNRRAKFYSLTRLGRRQLETGDGELGKAVGGDFSCGEVEGGVRIRKTCKRAGAATRGTRLRQLQQGNPVSHLRRSGI